MSLWSARAMVRSKASGRSARRSAAVRAAGIRLSRCAPMIAVGFSIGSGVAARLATERPIDGAILVTPFDSLKAAAQGLYPWVPIGPFFRHEIDAAEALERSEVPIAIIAGERDSLIQPERTDALRARARKLAFDRTIAGAGHNDIYARSEFQEAMRAALAKLSGSRRAAL